MTRQAKERRLRSLMLLAQANALNERAVTHLHDREIEDARRLCEEGIARIARDMPVSTGITAAAMHVSRGFLEGTLARVYEALGNDNRSLAARQRALGEFAKARTFANPDLLGSLLWGVSESYAAIADIQQRKNRPAAECRARRLAADAALQCVRLTQSPPHLEMFVTSMIILGDSWIKSGDNKSAIASFNELRRFLSNAGIDYLIEARGQVLATTRLAWALYNAKEWVEARQTYVDAIALCQEYASELGPSIQVMRGDSHHNLSQIRGTPKSEVLGHLRQAIAAFDTALTNDPDDMDAACRKAGSMVALARQIGKMDAEETTRLVEDALCLLDAALTAHPTHHRVLEAKAEALTFVAIFEGTSGRVDHAAPRLQESVAIYDQLRAARQGDPDLAHAQASTLMLLGQAYLMLKQEPLALEPLQRALASVTFALHRDPENVQYRETFRQVSEHFEPT
jgi:tetratricopeptide (TPR) repeat protein